ncbi:MAG: ABC transporter permease [Gemmatimonadota bacterium]|nr:MAG: ABC transporter permease [Gemmatimonadota bacterium]
MNSLGQLLRDRRATTGLVILAILGILGLLAPIIAPADPVVQHDVLRTRFLPPFATGPDGNLYMLGTDRFGRDLLSRLVYGARISLAVGLLSVAVSVGLGAVIGLASAYFGGTVEKTLMALTDAALAMPRLVLLLALITLWEPSMLLVVLVLGLTGWMGIARLTRAEVKGLMGRAFVDAAKAAGIGDVRLIARHLLPNAVTPLLVAAALGVGNAIMLEAGLSFLGLGVPPPAPSWGNMIAGGRDALVNAPWIATFPGIMVVLTVVACNLLGDGARDALDPKTR